ncbi:MAG: universal stress protein [Proteobacteria bacterium]|nr:universal stress protein [Pseudomonadota bacterium]
MAVRIATILLALAPGSAGKTAIRQALRLALFLKAELLAVSVTPSYGGNMHRWKISNADEQLSEPFKRCLEEARQMVAENGQVLRTIHTVGDPVLEIVRTAEEEQASLLLLGYPKRTRIERILLGRTAAKVISGSPCDVLMVPEHAEVHFSRILVGIDGSSFSMEAGLRALELALAFGGEVHALTVLDIPIDRGLLYGVLDEARRHSFPPLQVLADQGQRLGVRVVTEILDGSPYATIVNYSVEKNIELIVLGSHGRAALADMPMGSVVERVISLSSRPTLVVKKG